MDALTADHLAALARERGMSLTPAEIQGLLPLVQAGHAMMATVEGVDLTAAEPASQYRML